jgi:hypothetical protein
MTIPPDKETEILRLFHAERWNSNTIAMQLGLNPRMVARLLRDKGLLPTLKSRPLLADPKRRTS